MAVVNHHHRLPAVAQDARHLRDRCRQITGVMQTADAHDNVERRVGVGNRERRALRDACGRVSCAEHLEPVHHHRDRTR